MSTLGRDTTTCDKERRRPVRGFVVDLAATSSMVDADAKIPVGLPNEGSTSPLGSNIESGIIGVEDIELGAIGVEDIESGAIGVEVLESFAKMGDLVEFAFDLNFDGEGPSSTKGRL